MASGYYRAGVNFQAEIVNNRDRVTGIGEIPEAAVAAHANAFIKLSAALNIDRRRVVYVIHRYSPGFLAAIHSAFETTTSVHQSKSLEEHQKADLKATMRGRVTAAVRTKGRQYGKPVIIQTVPMLVANGIVATPQAAECCQWEREMAIQLARAGECEFIGFTVINPSSLRAPVLQSYELPGMGIGLNYAHFNGQVISAERHPCDAYGRRTLTGDRYHVEFPPQLFMG